MVSVMLVGLAAADPGALRVGAQEAPAVVLGTHTASASAVVSGVEIAAWWRLPDGAAGISAGRSVRTTGRSGRAGFDLGASAGPGTALTSPSLLVSLSPYARRWRAVGQGELGAALAVPAAVQLTGGVEARVPLLLELSTTWPVGPVQLGLLASGGAVIAPDWPGFALERQVGLVVTR